MRSYPETCKGICGYNLAYFMKGDTNIYFEYITSFEKKKIFTVKNKILFFS